MKDCCKQIDNLDNFNQERLDLMVNVCKICGCRHFELTIAPIKLGTKFF